MNIVYAEMKHLEGLVPLFDLYRQFYECKPDPNAALKYLKARMENKESDIFVALEEGNYYGFVQLYPSFCSIDAGKIYILHDLFVDAGCRKKGYGEALMNRATDWAKENDAVRLDLTTEHTNKAGQHLYEKLGYQKSLLGYYSYSLDVT